MTLARHPVAPARHAARPRTPGSRALGLLASAAAILLTAITLTLLLPGAPAGAHAYLESSNPADGAALSAAPHGIRLSFSESVVLGASSVTLVDGDGRRAPVTNLRIEAADPSETEAPVAMVADVPVLAAGVYRLSWQTLSSDDLHRTHGVIVFGVRTQVAAAGQHEPLPRPVEILARWLMFAATALVIGAGLARRAYRDEDSVTARRSARAVLLIGAGTGAGAALALLLYQAVSASVPIGDALTGRYGLGWYVRQAGFVAVALSALFAGDRPREERARPARIGLRSVSVAGLAGVLLGSALTGHGSAGGPTRLTMDALHLGAVSCWIGGLAVILWCGRGAERRAALVRFGRPAGWSVALTVATGLYLAGAETVSLDAIARTFYGRTLVLKVALVVIVGVLGGLNHRRLRRRSGTPRATVLIEAAVGTLVVLLAAVLTSSQPARESIYLAPPAPSVAVDQARADLQQTLTVKPNQPGQNVVSAEVFQTRRPAPGPITTVRIALRRSIRDSWSPAGAAQAAGDGRWSLPIELSTAGALQIQVTTVRAGLPAVVTEFPWTVGVIPGSRPSVLLSDRASGPGLRTAGFLAVLLIGGVAVLLGVSGGHGGDLRARAGGARAGDGGTGPTAPEPGPDGATQDGPAVLALSGKTGAD
ncbi:copper resistance protein CopC/CopD [Jatrophihabitans telluris]|uniref:Copper resistance protein CopC/CopD n=1 Tax=Jatrophihabitans telluris TaxID=2038343 RepID=A0ABY4QUS9_9ACTN|nr:copper resistance protein CopC [Jatrophihabitans telluris]UQX87380.1 copper resistance protein CopC/CopD [Jatrophihabitans telluris]